MSGGQLLRVPYPEQTRSHLQTPLEGPAEQALLESILNVIDRTSNDILIAVLLLVLPDWH